MLALIPFLQVSSLERNAGCQCSASSVQGPARAGSDHLLPSELVLCWHRFLRWGRAAAAASPGKLLAVQTRPQAEAQVRACSPVQGAGRAGSESWPACSKATLLQQQATCFLPILTGPSGQMMQASCWVSGSQGGWSFLYPHTLSFLSREKALASCRSQRF